MRSKNYRIVMITVLCFSFTYLSALILAPHTEHFYNLSQKEKLSHEILTSPELKDALSPSEIQEVERISQVGFESKLKTWPQKIQSSIEGLFSANLLFLAASLLSIVLSIFLLIGRDSLAPFTWICPLFLLVSPLVSQEAVSPPPFLSVNTPEMRKRLDQINQSIKPAKEEWNQILIEHYLQEPPSREPATFTQQTKRASLKLKAELLRSDTPLYPPKIIPDPLIYWLSVIGLFSWALFLNFHSEE